MYFLHGSFDISAFQSNIFNIYVFGPCELKIRYDMKKCYLRSFWNTCYGTKKPTRDQLRNGMLICKKTSCKDFATCGLPHLQSEGADTGYGFANRVSWSGSQYHMYERASCCAPEPGEGNQ